MASYCVGDPTTPTEIREALERIEDAAGDLATSADNPCGLSAYYDDGEPKPWRIAVDGAFAKFATAEEAEAEAERWDEETTE